MARLDISDSKHPILVKHRNTEIETEDKSISKEGSGSGSGVSEVDENPDRISAASEALSNPKLMTAVHVEDIEGDRTIHENRPPILIGGPEEIPKPATNEQLAENEGTATQSGQGT